MATGFADPIDEWAKHLSRLPKTSQWSARLLQHDRSAR